MTTTPSASIHTNPHRGGGVHTITMPRGGEGEERRWSIYISRARGNTGSPPVELQHPPQVRRRGIDVNDKPDLQHALKLPQVRKKLKVSLYTRYKDSYGRNIVRRAKGRQHSYGGYYGQRGPYSVLPSSVGTQATRQRQSPPGS